MFDFFMNWIQIYHLYFNHSVEKVIYGKKIYYPIAKSFLNARLKNRQPKKYPKQFDKQVLSKKA